jgi:hypothetical protein
MFSTFTCLTSVITKQPAIVKPNTIKPITGTNAPTTLSGNGTYDISENGQCIGIVNNANQCYLSTNGGTSFTLKGTLPTSISAFHMSDTGQYMITQKNVWANQIVYYSIDYGVNWTTYTITTGEILSTGISANGQYAIMSGLGTASVRNVIVSQDYMANWSSTWSTPISVTENVTVTPNTNINVYASGGFIDRQNGQNILISSSNSQSKPTNLQYYSSTNAGTSFTFKTFSSVASAPYGRRAYVNGSCIILTTISTDAIYVSVDSGSSFTKASSSVLSEVSYPNILHWNDNHIISNANGSKIYYVYNRHIYVSTDQLQTSSVYASNVSNEINSDNNLMGIVKASSTGKYMLTWNNGLIITTNTLI